MTSRVRPSKLDDPVDLARDHILGNPEAELTLVEYGSYACRHCHAVHGEIAELRDFFGDRMRYVFRHRPLADNDDALRAAELAEYSFLTTGQFWPAHDALMKRGPAFTASDFQEIAGELHLPPRDADRAPVVQDARRRVQEDAESAERNGALITPTFFTNNRRYEGPWDYHALAEALLDTLGHRIHAATVDFVRWGPSAGFLLLLMSVAGVILMNSSVGPRFESWWRTPCGFALGGREFMLPLVRWVNDGLLSVFFFVVGLEIKREFTVGRLASLRAGALPVAAAIGGIITPAVLYLLVIQQGPWLMGWGVPISTDTAFAVAIMVALGDRVPVALRVLLTAAVIIDDLVAIGVIAVFYSESIDLRYLIASVAISGLLVALNYWGIYSPLPYAMLGVLLWISLQQSGVHATLAGVILAIVTPTRPPANLRALMAQAEAVIQEWTKRSGDAVMRHGPSQPVMQALDTIHNRIESPADKLLRSAEPWSSYVVLPIFALANAGVVLSLEVVETHGRLMVAIILALVVGKLVGITAGAWLAVRFGIAVKPAEYSWRQLCGAGALGGVGFTMSLFIASEAFPNAADFAGAKIAIFIASLLAGVLGACILWSRPTAAEAPAQERK